MFTEAVEWDIVEEETLKRVRKAKLLEGNNRRLRYLAKEEGQALMNSCGGRLGHLKPVAIAPFNTGMRRGEILNLQCDYVDLRHGFILLKQTKNGERREIPISDTLGATLQGLARRLDDPYLLYHDTTGRPFRNVKRAIHSALKRTGMRDSHFHDLRHTFASHLVMAGVDLTTAKELLGHKTLAMTLRYSHLAPSRKVDGLDSLDNASGVKSTAQKVHKKGAASHV